MVTNYPQEMITQPVGATAEQSYADGTLSRLWKRVQVALCSLHGHDPLLHFDQNRMYLRCASCGHETPGWDLDERRPRVRFHGNPQHHLGHRAVSGPRTLETRERRIA